MKKIILRIILAVMMAAMMPIQIFAVDDSLLTLEELRTKKGAITVEAYNIGQGFLMEPTLFDKAEEKSVGDITVSVLEDKKIGYQGSTSYFAALEFDDTVEAIYPEYLADFAGEFDLKGDGDGYLSEFDYSYYAGWCYTVSDWWASWGADSSYPGGEITDYNTGETVVLGDVIRWHFTVYGYGADCGFPSNVMSEYMGGNLFTQEDKSNLIFMLAAINDYYGNLTSDDVYETALAVAANPLAAKEEIEETEKVLEDYIEITFFGTAAETEITGFDGEKVYFTFADEGVDVTVIFADYEDNRLNMTKSVPVVTRKTEGKNGMYVPVPNEMKISDNDKIMLWENYVTCVPLCQEYVVNGK